VLAALAAVLLAALVWSLGVALADSSSPSPTAGKKIVLQVGWYQNLDSLNPFIGYQNVSYDVYRLNYDYLVNYDSATLKPIPGLAQSWDHSADGKVWTFHIRKGVTWQDGQPLTANDVAFTFNWIVDHDMSAYTTYTTGIKHVTATDDHTAVFTCVKPKAGILQMWVPILPQHVWSKLTPDDAQNKFQNLPPVIGSGPFQVVEWKKGQFVRMEANKGYWNGAPKVDEILFRIYTNQETIAADLKQGSIQYADVAPAQYQTFLNQATWTAHKAVDDSFEDIGINCYTGGPSLGNPVLKDWRFRNALNWAIDRAKIAAIAYHGAAIPATSFLPSTYWKPPFDYHWQPAAGQMYAYDPAKAKQLLDAAGYRDTNGDGIREYKGTPISLRLWSVTEKNEYIVTGRLVAGWLKDVGFKVTFATMDDGALSDHIYNMVKDTFTPDYDLFIWGWGGDFDPGFLLSIFLTNQINGWSDCAYSNTTYDGLFTQQDQQIDSAARLQTIYRMEQLIFEQTPYIAYVYPQTLQVYDTTHWTGWVNQPAGTGTVNNVWTYLRVAPKTAAPKSAGASGTVIAVVVVVVCALIAVWLVARRRRRPTVEEMT
jgi:peptide/nickel transport system substrate-binding protein